MRGIATTLIVLTLALPLPAQQRDRSVVYDTSLYNGLSWRMIGPHRGGRSTAVAGIAGQPDRYLMGTTGGGVWQTDDAGTTWTNVSDGFFGGSIGAVDVADSDPNVIYVGTGSACIRGNTSAGRGMYKSVDGGKTWTFIGLEQAGQIGRIQVHPRNPELVYVAALGHAFGKNRERGVFRSTDGGATWQQVLFLDDSTGAVDLALNPRNPRVLYAGMWRAERKPWTLISGGPDGGVYKSTDGGDTWNKLAGGLPAGMVGKVGVTVSPANPDRVWAIVEAEPEGGVYRSDDAGKSWTRVNSENKLRQRAFYYTHIVADPRDEHTVYALNTRLYRSVDGGKTFDQIEVPHGDVHDLWINPHEPQRMVVADDGGAQVTVNGGKTWTTYYNQPTAELYDVIVDNRFPYRVYGAQQDNTTISVSAWTSANLLHPMQDWGFPGGCETGSIGLHPDHPEYTFGGCYSGVMDRVDHIREQRRNVNLYPQVQVGEAARNLKYRFQWVSPIVVSPHDPAVIYHGSQFVHRSTDRGLTWSTISPDLTTNDPAHQNYAGGPINHDITGVEIYNTVFSIAVSPHDPAVIWAGTDDGRMHVTRDNGATWTDITPRDMPALGTVDMIDPSVHEPGRAVLAVQRYRMDDFTPYVFRTDDFGRSWARIADGRNGIPPGHPIRAVREDPARRGLLYAGGEFGVYVSFDDGRRWQSLQRNLPITPITGMEVRHGDVIVSTQGRSFWVLDDVAPLRQMSAEVAGAPVHLFAPRDAYRVDVGGEGILDAGPSPEPLPGKVLFYYSLRSAADDVLLDILDADGNLVRRYTSDSATAKEDETKALPATVGMHRVSWDLKYPGPKKAKDVVLWGYSGGVKAPPGAYQARITVGDHVQTHSFAILKDPRLDDVTDADFRAQFQLAVAIRDTLNRMYRAIDRMRAVREQARNLAERAEGAAYAAEVRQLADSLAARITTVEQELTQTKNESGQDPLRFPPKLDSQYLSLYEYVTADDNYRFGGAEGRPPPGAFALVADLDAQWAPLSRQVATLLQTDLAAFNAALQRLGVPGVMVPSP